MEKVRQSRESKHNIFSERTVWGPVLDCPNVIVRRLWLIGCIVSSLDSVRDSERT